MPPRSGSSLITPAPVAIQFFVLISSRARASARPADERLTFSARAEKVSKETRPRALRPTRILRAGSTSAAGFRWLHIPVQATESARSIAPPLRAFPTAAAAMQWGPGEARAAARSCAQKQGHNQELCMPLLLIWPVIFLPLHRTEHRRRRRGKGAHVRAQGCASSRRPTGAEKRRAPRAQRARGAVSGAASFWLLFLRWRRKNDPRAGRARKGEGMRLQKIKSSDAGFRLPPDWRAEV